MRKFLFLLAVLFIGSVQATNTFCNVCSDVIAGMYILIGRENLNSAEKVEHGVRCYCKMTKVPEQIQICQLIEAAEKEEIIGYLLDTVKRTPENICINHLTDNNTQFCSISYEGGIIPCPGRKPNKMLYHQLKEYVSSRMEDTSELHLPYDWMDTAMDLYYN